VKKLLPLMLILLIPVALGDYAKVTFSTSKHIIDGNPSTITKSFPQMVTFGNVDEDYMVCVRGEFHPGESGLITTMVTTPKKVVPWIYLFNFSSGRWIAITEPVESGGKVACYPLSKDFIEDGKVRVAVTLQLQKELTTGELLTKTYQVVAPIVIYPTEPEKESYVADVWACKHTWESFTTRACYNETAILTNQTWIDTNKCGVNLTYSVENITVCPKGYECSEGECVKPMPTPWFVLPAKLTIALLVAMAVSATILLFMVVR